MPNISFSSIILATKNAFAVLKKEGGFDNLTGQFSKLKKSRFVRDVTIVAGGTAVAQAITVAFSPIITRLYGPEAFGVLGVFVAIIAMLTPVATLSYALAIVLPASDGDARALAKLSLIIALCVAAVIAVVFGFFHQQIAHLFGFEASALYLLIIPIVILLTASEQVLSQWLIRKKQFRAISGVAVAQAATVNVSKTGVGLLMATAPVLLIINAIGHILHTIFLWFGAQSTLSDRVSQNIVSVSAQKASMKDLANTYRDYPLFRSPQIMLNSISQNIPTLMLAAFFGPIPAGFYALTRRVLTLPKSLISQSVGKVFFPRIAALAQQGKDLQPYIVKATGGLALIGLLPFGIVILFGPWIFSFIFGSEWFIAGEYARWLSLWLYFTFLNVPSVQAIPLLDLQGHFLVYEVLSITVRSSAIAFGALVLSSDVVAIMLFSIGGAVLNVLLISWVILRSKNRVRKNLGERVRPGHKENRQ